MGESGSDSRSDSQSDFGVKISIQALKGHPFVILEGNDAKKKYVPAPAQQDFEQSDEKSDEMYSDENQFNYMPQSAQVRVCTLAIKSQIITQKISSMEKINLCV